MTLEDWIVDELEAAEGEAKESHKAAMNSYGAGHDAGYVAALKVVLKIGSFEIIHHTETVKPESFVVFTRKNGKLERATQFGRRGGFKTMQAAQEAVTNTVRFGTTNV